MKRLLLIILCLLAGVAQARGYLGNFAEDATVHFKWNTFDDNGASVTRATNGTIYVYKDDNTADETTTGVTDTEDHDSNTGVHHCKIDTSADAFYATGHEYFVVVKSMTVDGDSISTCLAHFSIENRFTEVNVVQWNGSAVATPSVAGVPEVDVTHTKGTASAGDAGYVAPDLDNVTGTLDDAEVADDAIGDGTNLTEAGGTGDQFTGLPEVDADVVKISGDGPAADNLEAILDGNGVSSDVDITMRSLTITHDAGTAVDIDGTTHAIEIDASSGHAVDIAAGGVMGSGIYSVGSGMGYGIAGMGGATGGHGIYGGGQSSGSGISGVGGATGHGIDGLGGATSGDGAHFAAQTSGDGLECAQAGAGTYDINADIHGTLDTVTTLTNAFAWPAAWDADVQSEVNDALVQLRLDHLVAVADADDVVDDSIIAKLASGSADWSTFAYGIESLEAIRGRGDVGWITVTAVQMRAALGLAAADLDTQLGDIQTAADANQTDLTTLLGRLTATRAGYLDAAISTRATAGDVQIVIP